LTLKEIGDHEWVAVKTTRRHDKIGETETGIMGLHELLGYVATLGITDEARLQDELVSGVRKAGNYIAPSRVPIYWDALLREYRTFYAVLVKRKEYG
jgi:hypothetical protein